MRSADQRQSVRLPVPPEREYAELRIGRRTIPARLLNQSSGGFAIQLDHDALVSTGQTLVLGTAMGWCRVRVAYLQRNDDGLYVGLRRLGDVPADWKNWTSIRIWPFHRLRVPLPGLGWSHCVFGGLIICGAVLAFAFWDSLDLGNTPGWIKRGSEMPLLGGSTASAPSDVSSNPSDTRDGAGTSSSPGLVPHGEGALPGRRGWIEREVDHAGQETGRFLFKLRKSAAATSGDLSADLRHVGERATDLAASVNFTSEELPDASLLLSPGIEKQLQITSEQRTEILAIVREGNEAAEAVYDNSIDSRSPSIRFQVSQVRKAASERAVSVLTAAQKKQLKTLRKP